jgi:hypothetical protein
MRWQTTAALAIVLIAVGAFYYVYEIRQGPEREKREGRKGRVFSAEPADVTEVELKRPAETVGLKREGPGWQMQEPLKTGADRAAVDETVTTIVTAKMDREVASTPAALAEFGLDKPAAEVRLTLKDGKSLGLLLGGKNPTGVWVYAKERDKPSVFVLPEGVLRDSTRPVADFRDKTVLAFDRKDVTGVDVALPAETISLAQEGGKWALTRPAAYPADGDLVSDFLDKLGGAKVREFVAEAPPSLEPFGLARPVRVDVQTGKDKDRATKSLLLGRVDETKKGVYAMRPGESSVLLLPEEVSATLPRTVAALRNKALLDVAPDKISRVDVESPKGAVTLVRDADRWKITAPEALAADQVEAGGILFKLRELRAQAFLTDDASGIARYLAKPEVKVTVTSKDSPPVTVLLAPSPELRGGRPSAYAAVEGRGPVILVDGRSLTDLSKSVSDVRDRTLFGDLQPRDARRVRVTVGGKTMVLERSGERDWKMLEPSKRTANASKVEDLLYMLRALKWTEIVSPDGADAGKYGLDAPAMTITALKADGGELASLAIGARANGRAYVRTGKGPAIQAVDAKQLGDPPKVPEDFQG